jgi:hypothetical protein
MKEIGETCILMENPEISDNIFLIRRNIDHVRTLNEKSK